MTVSCGQHQCTRRPGCGLIIASRMTAWTLLARRRRRILIDAPSATMGNFRAERPGYTPTQQHGRSRLTPTTAGVVVLGTRARPEPDNIEPDGDGEDTGRSHTGAAADGADSRWKGRRTQNTLVWGLARLSRCPTSKAQPLSRGTCTCLVLEAVSQSQVWEDVIHQVSLWPNITTANFTRRCLEGAAPRGHWLAG